MASPRMGLVSRCAAALGAARGAASRESVARWLPGLATVAVVLTVWWPFFRTARVDNHAGDWLIRAHYLRYELNALLHDHQLPLWVTSPLYEQPRAAGVHELFANPETDVLSLTTLFAVFGGLLRATKLAFVVYLAAGVLGARRLVRALTGRASASFLATSLLALLALCNGSLVAKALIGHLQFLSMAFFPLALALLVESWAARLVPRARLFRAALGGALLAVAYYAGNTHPLLHFLLVFPGLFSLCSVAVRPSDLRVILPSSLVLAGSFLGVAAFKLLPGAFAFHGYKAAYVISYSTWRNLARNLVIHWNKKPSGGDFPHELNLYVGYCGVAILLLALTRWSGRARSLPVIAVAAAALALTKDGDALQHLPLLRTQGVFARFGAQALLAASVAASVRVDELLEATRGKRPFLRSAVLAVLSCLAIGLAVDLRANVKRVVVAYGVDDVPQPAEPIDVAPPFEVEAGRNVRLEPTQVSANAMTYQFEVLDALGPPLFVAKNLTVAGGMPHLRVEGGADLTEHDGKLAVRAAGSAGTFTLRYVNPLVAWGLAATVATCLGIAILGLAQGVQKRLGRR